MSCAHFDYLLSGDGTVTVAEVSFILNGQVFYSAAHSHRMPGDSNDQELGDLLAIARALESISDSMFAKAEKRVKGNDKKAADKKNKRTKAEWEAIQREKAMEAHPAGKGK